MMKMLQFSSKGSHNQFRRMFTSLGFKLDGFISRFELIRESDGYGKILLY